MEKLNFILTSDKETAEKLKSDGFQFISKEGNFWRFLNNSKLLFSSPKEVIYTNKMNF